MKSFSNRQKGFTLLELLVVISIIALLSSVILAATTVARSKARDSKRLEDFHGIRVALESYYQENNAYPVTFSGLTPAYWGNCSDYGSHGVSGATGWVPGLAPGHIAALPLDPLPVSTDGCYLYASDGIDYKILALHTVEYDCPVAAASPYYDAGRTCTYAFGTPGAEAW